jgi:hypothetical protein
MTLLIPKLTPEEQQAAQRFYQKLTPTDLNHVHRVIDLVDIIANDYLSSYQSINNGFAFRDFDSKEMGAPFFGVYLIGGYANKEGDRKDIDLLVATNAWWDEGFIEGEEDHIWTAIKQSFSDDATIVKNIDLPIGYDVGAENNKVLINITPYVGKSLDLCYVRSWWGADPIYKFISEQKFIERDVDKDGKPLTRIPLYRVADEIDLSKSPRGALYR